MHGVQPNANAMPTSIAPTKPAGRCDRLHPLFLVQPLDAQHAHRVQAEDDDDRAGDPAEHRQPRHQELADGARRRAERDEDEREAEDERERRRG